MAHILLADDDFEDRYLMSETFKELGQIDSLSFVEDGGMVMSFLENNHKEDVTLVVLDLNMPRVNGTEALKQIKSHEAFKNIPVIIFSTSVNEVERERALALGAKSYMVKPTTFSEYIETCKQFLKYADGQPL